ncbi:Glutathione S-transferase [Phaffia rhodozyma]|uniref:Glutathione S-transferase n=1 Tax=Phaffia rhodozyma TaxID=264483 RepID=A0A0F7SWF7_PHARH|nr:Glutathione S-transferase [Phaffia rhodozyma]
MSIAIRSLARLTRPSDLRTILARTMSTELKKPLELYSASTPNGQKATVFLEELKQIYPAFDYHVNEIDIQKNEQKEEWFLKINPNGRIPALVDPNRGDHAVWESAAILLYLEKHYDPDHKFSFGDSADEDNFRSEILQWMFFVHGGIGPMQGQAVFFSKYAPEQIPYAIKRYQDETKRLYSVLDTRLRNRDYLVGPGRGKYSIADANALPWVFWSPFAGIDHVEIPTGVKAWLDRNLEREPTMRGLKVGPNTSSE